MNLNRLVNMVDQHGRCGRSDESRHQQGCRPASAAKASAKTAMTPDDGQVSANAREAGETRTAGGADHPAAGALTAARRPLRWRGNAWTASAPGPDSSTRSRRRRAASGRAGHAFVDQPADDLAVLQHEGRFVAAHFQHPARAGAAGSRPAETGIEEARVMHPELADHRQIGRHLGGVVGRDRHRLAADEDVEGAGVEDDPRRRGCGPLPRNPRGRNAPIRSRSITPVWGLAR